MPEDSWFPNKVKVKSPEGDTYNFPIYRWITDSKVYRFREGTGPGFLLITEDKQRKKKDCVWGGLSKYK